MPIPAPSGDESEVVSRLDAKARKLKRYRTGLPCVRGHVTERYTSNGKCVTCAACEVEIWREANVAKIKDGWQRWKAKRKLKGRKPAMSFVELAARRNESRRKWSANNKNKRAKAVRLRRANDIQFRLAMNLRTRLTMALRKRTKRGSAVTDLGCSIDELKTHLEKQFIGGMDRRNYGRGGWEIDHKIPLASFDLTDATQLKQACHYTNLQPLWALDNARKNAHTAA
jgi:hypothetical protein